MKADPKHIYLGKISESLTRIAACEQFLSEHLQSGNVFSLESAILQARKAFEAFAFASIAPNKQEYENFRAKSEEQNDFRKDFNARTIVRNLTAINRDFYPISLNPPTESAPGQWHFSPKASGYLTQKRFELLYDRFGRLLHSDNPWRTSSGFESIRNALPEAISGVRGLLDWHCTFIRTPSFNGTWVVDSGLSSGNPQVIIGAADGEFAVTRAAPSLSLSGRRSTGR